MEVTSVKQNASIQNGNHTANPLSDRIVCQETPFPSSESRRGMTNNSFPQLIELSKELGTRLYNTSRIEFFTLLDFRVNTTPIKRKEKEAIKQNRRKKKRTSALKSLLERSNLSINNFKVTPMPKVVSVVEAIQRIGSFTIDAKSVNTKHG
ncbi:hypothetical protein CEXT_125531 [Caerostris extrusa]|uniref:Uncharacterized protein n=1 Tax=Caerostris extrusa TaxID=172846 RepID=A0AAV4NV59_CAEEX|nr:hypothetical protein CEXT_125531 [Caerostris extrusa]